MTERVAELEERLERAERVILRQGELFARLLAQHAQLVTLVESVRVEPVGAEASSLH